MARPKKAEDKPKDSGSLQISVEDFVRTRNSVSCTHFLHSNGFVATRLVDLITLTSPRLTATTEPPSTLTTS